MSKFGRRIKEPPPEYEVLEPVISALDAELREKVNEPHEGLRKTESQWPIHQINWQKSRYVYDMYYTYNYISKELYDYCIANKIVDANLIAKWKKPGYERLCSTYVINPRNYKFGTVSICRVPKHFLAPGAMVEDPTTGCQGCASGPGGCKNIFGNKYGQYLAAIQIAREERRAAREAAEAEEAEREDDEDGASDDEEDKEEAGPVGHLDGSSMAKTGPSLWATEEEEAGMELPDYLLGSLQGDAEKEGMQALKKGLGGGTQEGGDAKKRKMH